MKKSTTKKNAELTLTAEQVMVKRLDVAGLMAEVSEEIKSLGGVYAAVGPVTIYHYTGLIMFPVRKPMLVSDEAVGLTAEVVVGKEDGKPVTLFRNIDFYQNEPGHFAMIPSLRGALELGQVLKFCKEEVTLVEFMGSRRGYNSRIVGNEMELLRYFEHGD